MKILNIKLNNYRNYKNLDLNFNDGINILQGRNAQGKTNLLEAIYFCSIGKSLRVSREKEVIKFNEITAKINLKLQKKYKKTLISLFFSKNTKKTVKIDNIPIKKIGELMGEFYAVYFSPDELKLVKESPEDRRRFMDIHISQTSKSYFYYLSRYEKILLNRNKLLKTIQLNKNNQNKEIEKTIEIWDKQLIEVGSRIILFRNVFIKKLQPYANKIHSYLTNNEENLKLEYTGIKNENLENIKEKFIKSIKESFNKDLNLGYTSFGPHRDDIKVLSNDIDIRLYGSQGQQRTVALSLKLAELEIVFEETGEMPVLLLDDVLSELDVNRRKKLLNYCKKTQTIITGTDFEYNEDYSYFKIENGQIVLIKENKKI